MPQNLWAGSLRVPQLGHASASGIARAFYERRLEHPPLHQRGSCGRPLDHREAMGVLRSFTHAVMLDADCTGMEPESFFRERGRICYGIRSRCIKAVTF